MSVQKKNRFRTYFEGALILLAIFLGIRWVLNPSGAFEPIITLCLLVFAAVDFLHRSQSAENSHATFQDPVAKANISRAEQPEQAKESQGRNLENRFGYNAASAFFAARFATAFPGLRGTQWFERAVAIERLLILLAPPLEFQSEDGGIIAPIWWFRDGNLQIFRFAKIDSGTVLMDGMELRIARIAAISSSNYKRNFVYVECEPMNACGIYEWTTSRLQEFRDDFGYVWEEYGLYLGTHFVSRAEYDDGATKIMGKIVQMGDNVELRVRYLTPYNFIIAPHDSPINSKSFDQELEQLLNRILEGSGKLEELSEAVTKLPLDRGYR